MVRIPWTLRGFAVLLALVATTATAQEKTLRIATQNPKGHPIVLGLERFAELVEARSRGRVKVMVFPGSTLGSDEVSIAALQAGTLEMASLNSGILANQVKAFAVFDLPLLLSGDGDADALLDGVSESQSLGGRIPCMLTTSANSSVLSALDLSKW